MSSHPLKGNARQKLIFSMIVFSLLFFLCEGNNTVQAFGEVFPDIIFVQVPGEMQGVSPGQGSAHHERAYGQEEQYIDGCRIVRVSSSTGTLEAMYLTADFFSAVDPAISFDAKTILFSGKKTKADSWQIYRMNVDGSSLVPLTRGPADHISPLHVGTLFYLNDSQPAGQIIYVEKKKGPDYSHALMAGNLDGTNPRQISFNLFGDMEPDVMPNGRVVFSSVFKREFSRNDLNTRLMAVNIDGTDLMPFTGDQLLSAHQRMPRAGFDRRLYFIESDSPDYLTGGQIASVSQFRSLHSRKMVAPLNRNVYHSPCPLPDGKLLVSFRESSGQELYAIGMMDEKTGNLIQTVFSSPEYHCVDTQLVVERKQSRGRSSVVGFKYEDSGVFFCMDVYNSDRKEIIEKIQSDIVKQVLITRGHLNTGNPINTISDEATISPAVYHQILGKIPVEKDGSFHVRVPAKIPLTFHLLDENGMSIGSQKSFTWVMQGENRGCIGCHEDRELAPPNRFIEAMKKAENKLSFDPEKSGTIDFVNQVFPILETKCSTCHVTGKTTPFLDDPEAAFNGLVHGKNPMVIPFNPKRSPFIKKLFDTGRKSAHGTKGCSEVLSDSETKILVDWINIGASYQTPSNLSISTRRE